MNGFQTKTVEFPWGELEVEFYIQRGMPALGCVEKGVDDEDELVITKCTVVNRLEDYDDDGNTIGLLEPSYTDAEIILKISLQL